MEPVQLSLHKEFLKMMAGLHKPSVKTISDKVTLLYLRDSYAAISKRHKSHKSMHYSNGENEIS